MPMWCRWVLFQHLLTINHLCRCISLPLAFSSSAPIKLCINIDDFNDCLALLDGRLTQLTTFIAKIDSMADTSRTDAPATLAPEAKIKPYQNQIHSLSHPHSHLHPHTNVRIHPHTCLRLYPKLFGKKVSLWSTTRVTTKIVNINGWVLTSYTMVGLFSILWSFSAERTICLIQ